MAPQDDLAGTPRDRSVSIEGRPSKSRRNASRAHASFTRSRQLCGRLSDEVGARFWVEFHGGDPDTDAQALLQAPRESHRPAFRPAPHRGAPASFFRLGPRWPAISGCWPGRTGLHTECTRALVKHLSITRRSSVTGDGPPLGKCPLPWPFELGSARSGPAVTEPGDLVASPSASYPPAEPARR
jgi:hypothetical protein